MFQSIRKAIVVFALIFISYNVVMFIFLHLNGYSIEFGFDDRYLVYLNKEQSQKVNQEICVTETRDTDSYIRYTTKDYYYSFHEFYKINDFNKVDIYLDSTGSDFSYFTPYQVINEDSRIDPNIKALWDLELTGNPSFLVSPGARIDTLFRKAEDIILVGRLEELYLADGLKTRVIWTFKDSYKAVVLVLRRIQDRLLLITVQSSNGVSIKDLQALDLD